MPNGLSKAFLKSMIYMCFPLFILSMALGFNIFTINYMPQFAFRVDEAGLMMLPFLCSRSPNRKSSWFFTNCNICCLNIVRDNEYFTLY